MLLSSPFSRLIVARRSLIGLGACLLLAVAVLFQLYPTFGTFFMADDYGWLRFARSHGSPLQAATQPSLGDWTTPVSNLVFWSLFKTFGYDPRGYYLVIALIHLFNAWLVYNLVKLVTRKEAIAIGAAFVFALHFIHFSDWGPLVWISAFVQVLAASFYLASLVLFVQYVSLPRPLYYAAALLCFGLALAAKETAVTLPLVLAAWYVLRLLPDEGRWKQTVIRLAPFFAVLSVYLLYKVFFQQTSGRYLEVGLYRLGTHVISNWKYFSNLVMPNPQSPPVISFLTRAFPGWVLVMANVVLSVTRFLLLVLGVVLWWRGPKHARMWIVLALVAYLPFVGFIEGNAGANRYFYLPAAGLAALVAEGVGRLHRAVSQRKGMVMATAMTALVVLSLWVYGLVPIRSWQRQMQANSQLSQQVISALEEHLGRAETEVTQEVYLAGFSANDFEYLERIILLAYGMDVVELPRGGLASAPPDGSLTLLYRNQRVSRASP